MNWREKFEEAGKLASSSRSGFLSVELSPEKFTAALKALDNEMEGLSRGDPRYQEACRTGRLTWRDEQGRAVEVVRKGAALPVATEADVMAAIVRANRPAPFFSSDDGPTAPTISTPLPEKENQDITSLRKSAADLEASANDGRREFERGREPSGIVAAVKSVLPKGKKK